MRPVGPLLGRAGLWLFAVEDTAAQLTWRDLPPGPATLRMEATDRSARSDHSPTAEDQVQTLHSSGGPGAARLSGLAPATTYRITVAAGGKTVGHRTCTTLPELEGPELTRFATISDLHIGDTGFGILRKQRAPEIEEGYPLACARAAISDAIEWGAQAIVVKGDLTRSSRTVELEQAAALLAELPVPVAAVRGNHDVARKGVDAVEILARRGVAISEGVQILDLPGVRIALLPSAHAGRHGAEIKADDLDQLTGAIAVSDRAAWVGVHHYLQPLPFPTTYPPGIPSGPASRLLRGIAAANPRSFVSTGHSHRCRVHHRHGVPISEVGAPKDYPGVWAGYVVHRSGIRQTVQRVAEPQVLAWNDRTRRAAAHLWGWYSPGTIDQRCFVHRWPHH